LCHECELNYEFLHDLHHGQQMTKKHMLRKCHYQLWMVDYGVISLLVMGYHITCNVQSMFGIRIT